MKLKLFDSGPWSAVGDRVYSSDFTHDVVLRISGDFKNVGQRNQYARALADTLNKSTDEDQP